MINQQLESQRSINTGSDAKPTPTMLSQERERMLTPTQLDQINLHIMLNQHPDAMLDKEDVQAT